MNHTLCTPAYGTDRDCFQARPQPWRRAIGVLQTWIERARQRRSLMQLDDRLLNDIGRSRAEAQIEAGKPFWRP